MKTNYVGSGSIVGSDYYYIAMYYHVLPCITMHYYSMCSYVLLRGTIVNRTKYW